MLPYQAVISHSWTESSGAGLTYDYYDVVGPGGILLTGSSKEKAAHLAAQLNAAFNEGYLHHLRENQIKE